MLNKITSIKMLILSAFVLSNNTNATCFGLIGKDKPDLFNTLPKESQAKFNQRTKALNDDVKKAELLTKHNTSLSKEYEKCVNDRLERLSTTAAVNPEQFAESDLIVAPCHRRFAEATSDLAIQARALAEIEALDKNNKLQHSALVAGIEKLNAQDAAKYEAKAADVKAVTDNEEAAANK